MKISSAAIKMSISACLSAFQELEVMNLNGMGPNFHKLKVFSNSFEDLIATTLYQHAYLYFRNLRL